MAKNILAFEDYVSSAVGGGVTQSNTYTDNKIKNIKIGGRNLYKNSDTVLSTSRFYEIRVNDILEPYIGQQIYVSFDMKINDSGTERPIQVYAYQDSGITINTTISFTPSKKWQRFGFPTTVVQNNVPSGYTPGGIGFYDYTGTNSYSLRNIKIELGNKGTEWSYANEDLMLKKSMSLSGTTLNITL